MSLEEVVAYAPAELNATVALPPSLPLPTLLSSPCVPDSQCPVHHVTRVVCRAKQTGTSVTRLLQQRQQELKVRQRPLKLGLE